MFVYIYIYIHISFPAENPRTCSAQPLAKVLTPPIHELMICNFRILYAIYYVQYAILCYTMLYYAILY